MDRTLDRSDLGALPRAGCAPPRSEDGGPCQARWRRAQGLRREEVAELCTTSADCIARLELGDGPRSLEWMLAAIARGLGLPPDE